MKRFLLVCAAAVLMVGLFDSPSQARGPIRNIVGNVVQRVSDFRVQRAEVRAERATKRAEAVAARRQGNSCSASEAFAAVPAELVQASSTSSVVYSQPLPVVAAPIRVTGQFIQATGRAVQRVGQAVECQGGVCPQQVPQRVFVR